MKRVIGTLIVRVKLWPVFTLFLLLSPQEAFVDSEDQDQTAQDMQSGPWPTLLTILF